MTEASKAQVLGPGSGWAVVLSVGIAFAFFMMAISWVQQRYTQFSLKTNEEFNSASRSVRKGLVSASIVSAWVWAATILQSSTVAFNYGISGPYWYSVGGTTQILVFAITASMQKLNAPYAHTFLQVIRVRWGKALHLITMFFALLVNVIVGSMLVTGGADVVNQLTGMPILAAVFLTPIAVAMYTLTGGLRATFFADYIHTSFLMALLLMFAIYTYAISDKIGSAKEMYELLTRAPAVAGNAGGSYTSFRSIDGFKFGVYNVISGFCGVYVDQSYHQRGIAADPAEATVGFILGGLAWYAVPVVSASTLGLGARALMGQNSAMANLSASDITAGLAAPAAAVAILGKAGAAAMLILLYLAVTSATSAELIAVSSIFTFDVVKTYVKPNATQRQLFICSHVFIAAWAIFLGILGCIWNAVGISLGYLYIVQGTLTSPAVFPIFACLGWSKANRAGALCGMVAGIICGTATWLAVAYKEYGELTLTSTAASNPTTIGSVVSIMVSTVITIAASLLWPESYTFEETRAINATEAIEQREQERLGGKDQHADSPAAESALPTLPSSAQDSQNEINETGEIEAKDELKKSTDGPNITLEKGLASNNANKEAFESDPYYNVRRGGLDPEALQSHIKRAIKLSLPLCFIIIIFIPCMAISVRDFGPTGLGAWIGVNIVGLFLAAGVVILLPIWESRYALYSICRGMVADAKGLRRR